VKLLNSENIPITDPVLPFSAIKMKNQEQETDIQTSNNVTRKDEVCTLCEEFAAQALDYMAENKTQTEILEILHKTCSRLTTFKQEVTFSFLADHYWMLNWKPKILALHFFPSIVLPSVFLCKILFVVCVLV
jgi:hypothetical protein